MTTGGFDTEQFVYIKIPLAIQPMDRGERFEDEIDDALSAEGLGEVSGGGSLLGNPGPDGRRSIEFCGIDVDTDDREAALKVLRNLLPGLGAPPLTELHYTANGQRLQDAFLGHDWRIGEPRTFLHPGFGV